MCRHFINKSIDSHVKGDSFEQPYDTLSSSYDDIDEDHFLALMTCDTRNEPSNYKEAMTCPEALNWQQAMEEEFQSMEDNKTWKLIAKTKLPPRSRIIDSTWVYRLKVNKDGTDRFRARLVGRGYKDPNVYDVSEVYAPVADINDIRAILAYANKHSLILKQLDIKVAFLNGDLEKPVFMSIPQGSKVDPNTYKSNSRSLSSSFPLRTSSQSQTMVQKILRRNVKIRLQAIYPETLHIQMEICTSWCCKTGHFGNLRR